MPKARPTRAPWAALPVSAAAAQVSHLNGLGYAVDEVRLITGAGPPDEVELRTVVSDRTHHSAELRALTGLQVGEGQAAVLLGDL